MSTKCNLILIGFAVLLASSASGAESIPRWLGEDAKVLLPPVHPKALSIMREAWPQLRTTTDVLDKDPEPPAFIKAANAVGELNEAASLALVWMYASDMPAEKELWKEAGREKQSILNALRGDPIAATWMVPLLRKRMDSLSSSLSVRAPHGADSAVIHSLGFGDPSFTEE